ncbi:hypothetical protein BDV93DRAFT_67592 [Ceratobasidium sp. AG-I]|nr:hypothetical protein BDV93DRAFT_67592 [Ceratobasidium sp. AG-I]
MLNEFLLRTLHPGIQDSIYSPSACVNMFRSLVHLALHNPNTSHTTPSPPPHTPYTAFALSLATCNTSAAVHTFLSPSFTGASDFDSAAASTALIIRSATP